MTEAAEENGMPDGMMDGARTTAAKAFMGEEADMRAATKTDTARA